MFRRCGSTPCGNGPSRQVSAGQPREPPRRDHRPGASRAAPPRRTPPALSPSWPGSVRGDRHVREDGAHRGRCDLLGPGPTATSATLRATRKVRRPRPRPRRRPRAEPGRGAAPPRSSAVSRTEAVVLVDGFSWRWALPIDLCEVVCAAADAAPGNRSVSAAASGANGWSWASSWSRRSSYRFCAASWRCLAAASTALRVSFPICVDSATYAAARVREFAGAVRSRLQAGDLDHIAVQHGRCDVGLELDPRSNPSSGQ